MTLKVGVGPTVPEDPVMTFMTRGLSWEGPSSPVVLCPDTRRPESSLGSVLFTSEVSRKTPSFKTEPSCSGTEGLWSGSNGSRNPGSTSVATSITFPDTKVLGMTPT